MPLRLALWNCNMRLHDKLEGLHRLAPDVIVLPECACPEVLLRRIPGLSPSGMAWTGRRANKGLAVLTFGAWRVATVPEHDVRGSTTLAARVYGAVDFRLAAVWALPDAAEPVAPALDRLRGFLEAGPSAIVGDFNDTLVRDGKLRRRIEAMGFRSAYHAAFEACFGEEDEPTLYLRRREGLRGHRDVVFLDATLSRALRDVAVGSRATWSRASDHAPVLVRIDT